MIAPRTWPSSVLQSLSIVWVSAAYVADGFRRDGYRHVQLVFLEAVEAVARILGVVLEGHGLLRGQMRSGWSKENEPKLT